MIFKLINMDPIGRISKKLKRLDAAFRNLNKKTGFISRDGQIKDVRVASIMDSMKYMRKLILKLEDFKKKFGRIDEQGVLQLSRECSSLTDVLEKIGSALRSSSGTPLSMNPLFIKVCREARRLGEDIRLLNKAAEREADSEDEKDLYYHTAKVLRAEIKRQDKNLAKGLTLSGLDKWALPFSGIDWDDKKMVQRVANIYALEQVPDQQWEIRYRPRSSGSPLIRVMVIERLPDLEDLQGFQGAYEDYYIAAQCPTWRKVWNFSWYLVGM